MKKMWNTPDIQELTIESTACTGWGSNGWGHGGWEPHRPGKPGFGKDDWGGCDKKPGDRFPGFHPGCEDDLS